MVNKVIFKFSLGWLLLQTATLSQKVLTSIFSASLTRASYKKQKEICKSAQELGQTNANERSMTQQGYTSKQHYVLVLHLRPLHSVLRTTYTRQPRWGWLDNTIQVKLPQRRITRRLFQRCAVSAIISTVHVCREFMFTRSLNNIWDQTFCRTFRPTFHPISSAPFNNITFGHNGAGASNISLEVSGKLLIRYFTYLDLA